MCKKKENHSTSDTDDNNNSIDFALPYKENYSLWDKAVKAT